MKKNLLNSVAVAAMSLLALACAKEQVTGDGQTVEATFEVDVPGTVVTKAIGDGMTAKKLYYQVFDADSNPISGLGVQNVTLSNGKASVSFQLVKDQTYNFVFWAQTSVDGYYTIDQTDGLRKISANYTDKKANDENFDAFYAVENLTVSGSVSKDVTLHRPFAQINIATAGKISAGSAAKDIDFTDAASTVTVKGVPTVFSPLATTDVFTGNADVTFAEAAVPAGDITVNSKDYKYLAVNYVFAPTGGTVYDLNATLSIEGKDVTLSVPTVPAKQNWRTNIVGDLLTSSANFNVVVDPSFDDENKLLYVSSPEDFNRVLSEAVNGQTIALTNSISLTSNAVISDKNVKIELNSYELSLEKNFYTASSNDGNFGVVTIKDGKINCMGTNSFMVGGSSKMIFDNVDMVSKEDTPILVSNTASLTVRNSNIDAKYYCVTTNASNPNQNPTIVIEKCTLTGNDPILVNVPCKLTVSESTMTGRTHGTVVRGGTAEFINCKIVLNYRDSDAADVGDWPFTPEWGSGNVVKIAALTLGNKSSSYQYPTNVNLKNTKVLLEGENARYFPSMYAYANQGDGLGVTIMYDDQCSFDSGKGIVYGSGNIKVNGVMQ